jgi:hypothetical protein
MTQLVETQAAIQRVLALYALLLDDLRFEEWGELFCEHATWTATWGGTSQTFEGRHQIVEGLRAIEPKKAGAVRHCPLAFVIDVNGSEAFCWSDAIVFSIAPEANVVVSVGRYHDILRHEGGRWRFLQRVFVPSGDPLPAGIRPCPGA